MKLFKCSCGWSWVIGKKNVYGPIVYGAQELARMQKFIDFREYYGDCYRNFHKRGC